MPNPDPMVSVEELDGNDIGKLIRVRVADDATEVTQVYTAELRQVYHLGDQTTLHIGYQAAVELVLEHGHSVSVRPRADYVDAIKLADRTGAVDGEQS